MLELKRVQPIIMRRRTVHVIRNIYALIMFTANCEIDHRQEYTAEKS